MKICARIAFAFLVTSVACAPRNCPDLAGSSCTGTVVKTPPGAVVYQQGVLLPNHELVNGLTPDERRAGWRLLFDGKTFTGWRGLGYDTVPTAHW